MRHIALIFILSIFTTFVSAQTTDNFESRIESFSSQNKTIQCDFVQTKKVKGVKSIITSQGEFFYDNSGLMALVYNEPEGDKVIINGEKFKVVTSGRVIEGASEENPMMEQICNMLQASMSGDVAKLGRGWQMRVADHHTQYEVVLQPLDRRTKKYIESLVMVFRKSDMTLDELRMNDSSDGYTLYEFQNKRTNVVIDPTKFE